MRAAHRHHRPDPAGSRAETTSELRGVVARLDKQNSSIQHLQEDSIKHSVELAERRLACPLLVPMQHELTDHVTGCPMKAKMDTVEDWMTAMKATADANGYWPNRLWPAFYGAAGVAVYVAALHAADIIKALSAK